MQNDLISVEEIEKISSAGEQQLLKILFIMVEPSLSTEDREIISKRLFTKSPMEISDLTAPSEEKLKYAIAFRKLIEKLINLHAQFNVLRDLYVTQSI